MTVLKQETYEFEIKELRTYTILGSGNGKFAAEQDAVERFHRLGKGGELFADKVGKPKVTKAVKRK